MEDTSGKYTPRLCFRALAFWDSKKVKNKLLYSVNLYVTQKEKTFQKVLAKNMLLAYNKHILTK